MVKLDKEEILRHSTAHVLAAAVLEMFPEAKFGMGPAIENGFYYDFELPRTLIPEDLPLLEERMKKIIKDNHKFERAEIASKKALDNFSKLKQSYKAELIKDLEEEGNKNVCLYTQGTFVDLCAGPHLDSTGEINPEAFKLTKISGAYWKGEEKNKQLQRIYGVVFETKKELENYLKQQEEAEKYDHKKLGKELDLFSFHPEAPGSPFWHPKGMVVWNELEKLGKSVRKKYGYLEIQTPILAKSALWKISGHWEHYKEGMYHFNIGKETYCLKPMDCPFNIKIYQEKQRSYKELPIRYTEIGRIIRKEKSGELNGLLRVANITQDDAHIFLTENQVVDEIRTLLRMVKEYYKIFGIEPQFFFATRPDGFMGDIKNWDKAEKDLETALEKEKIKHEVKEKDGAFYGPKIDIDIKDTLGRKWQLATIQLDFQLPERFKLAYIDKNGKKKTPVMIHAAIFGAFERFIGILLEHYGGKLPLWLSPIHVAVIPVSEKFNKYAEKVNSLLLKNNVRSEVNNKSETLGKRISEAEKQKIPYMVVVGEKEEKSETVATRERNNKKQVVMKLDEFVEKIKKEISEKN
ncbi:MAG: threonine--tRNA ligase [Candidatus Moranbacteria bacterium RIFCSPHIGHO2_02_FULL_40_12b]|nr:MAG: threonine--tRNA ligase [Candidatus Moranbacteria bacterium RIFCSPHIGHO2_02_FULL_40_12b]OGI22768.1 MAG: threonine--tRNA ligase [Candidatus Moranbacteria bacterium RIFCSPHIGHO2_12_FULL_40_10]